VSVVAKQKKTTAKLKKELLKKFDGFIEKLPKDARAELLEEMVERAQTALDETDEEHEEEEDDGAS